MHETDPSEEYLADLELLNEMGAMAKVGAWEADVKTGKQRWTQEVYKIYEVEPDFVPTVERGVSFYHSEDLPIIVKAYTSSVERGEPFDLELRFITAKKNQKWVRAIGKAVYEGGKIVKVRGTFQDISDVKLAKQAAEQIEHTYQIVFNSINDPIFIHDYYGNMLDVNEAACKKYGYTREEMLKLSLSQIDTEKQAQYIPERISNLRANGHAVFETEHRLKDGTEVEFEASAHSIDYRGQPAMISIMRDISERRKHDNEDRKRMRELQIFNTAAVDREKRIIELKKRIKELEEQLAVKSV